MLESTAPIIDWGMFFMGIGALIIYASLGTLIFRVVKHVDIKFNKEEKFILLEEINLEKFALKKGIDLNKELIKRKAMNNRDITKKLKEELYKEMFKEEK